VCATASSIVFAPFLFVQILRAIRLSHKSSANCFLRAKCIRSKSEPSSILGATFALTFPSLLQGDIFSPERNTGCTWEAERHDALGIPLPLPPGEAASALIQTVYTLLHFARFPLNQSQINTRIESHVRFLSSQTKHSVARRNALKIHSKKKRKPLPLICLYSRKTSSLVKVQS